jgi:IS1 family transposase
VAYVWGKRDLKTAKRLREKLIKLGISCGGICTDDWQSFVTTFKADNHVIGKAHTVGIEGNNCRFRNRIRRAFRKTENYLASFEREEREKNASLLTNFGE